jgi:hypothetical protein
MMIPEQAAIRKERPLVRKLWLGLGAASILSSGVFYCLWLMGEPGITYKFPLSAALATVAWFAFGLRRLSNTSRAA